MIAFYIYNRPQPIVKQDLQPIDRSRTNKVVQALRHSMLSYEKYAWGKDELLPLSQTGSDWFTLGLTIIDGTDTSFVMGQTDILAKCQEWIETMSFAQEGNSNVFEITIRVVGGLLSAFQLTHHPIYKQKAQELADILLVAFETHFPLSSVNLKERKAIAAHFNNGASSTAEATTLQLEFKYLSHVTGNPIYWNKVQEIMQRFFALDRPSGLVPVFLNPYSGQLQGNEIRLGSRGDSYYEYLAKQWIQTNFTEPVFEREYRKSVEGIRRHLLGISQPHGFLFVGERPNGLGDIFSTKMDHLVCFLPGTLALAATRGKRVTTKDRHKLSKQDLRDLELAEELARSCYEMYRQTPTGLASEIVFWNASPVTKRLPTPSVLDYHQGLVETADTRSVPDDGETDQDTRFKYLNPDRQMLDFEIHTYDGHNLLRPETVESLFVLYRITGKQQYREWGWSIFESFEKYSKIESGYTCLVNGLMIPPPKRDKMESFWVGETLKYFYLLFADEDVLPLDRFVFNTEAHPLPVFEPKEELKKQLLFLS
ncbi:mannosidase I [Gorgonomyces haynaldii]|nr:mannosidase I [Gorgonomyces haynaldii]